MGLEGVHVAVTAPSSYAPRLVRALERQGGRVTCCPTVAVRRTPHTDAAVREAVASLAAFGGIAFTSRAGIASVAHAMQQQDVAATEELLVAALGADVELIRQLDVFRRHRKLKLVVPSRATPDALVAALGDGAGRRLLCPAPLVCGGLSEPAVVPDMVAALQRNRWAVTRVDAYTTSWTGGDSIVPLLHAGADALVFTSTAEVEGLIKALHAHNLQLDALMPCLLVAYGPVTARGARQLGVRPDLVGHQFNSFTDLANLLVSHFQAKA